MTFNPDAATVFADGPSSDPIQPSKPQIRQLLTQYEAAIGSYATGAGSTAKTTRALLYADLAHAAGDTAWVYADSNTAYNGIYIKSGASGSGSWSRILPLPFSFVIGTDLGAGTANAIQITTDIPVSDGMVVMFQLFRATTSSPVTVSINGGTALTLKTVRGGNASALTAGQDVWFRVRSSDSAARMISDQDVAALVAQAEAARDEAVAAAAAIPSQVVDRTEMKALDTAIVKVAFLKENGREGWFKWTTGDYSAQIAADTAEGIYIKANAVASSSGAWVRQGVANVYHFGGSSTADSASAIAGMAAVVGFVLFPRGSTLVSTATTIDVPMYFDPDANITVATGINVNLTNTINAPRGQWIFRGAGTVTIPLPDTDSGEDTREVYAKWWGVVSQVALDQSVKIQKVFDALGNSREGVVHFDHGSIQIEGPMTVNRGIRIKGAGTRRTVFEVLGSDYTVFETAHTACFFEDIQFENLPKPSSPARTAPYIHIKHDFCEIKNIFHHPAYNAIIVDGPNCKIENVEGVYGSANPGAGSSQILIRNTGVSTKGVFCRYSSTYWPTYIIEIGTGATGSVTAFFIDQVEYVGGSVGIYVHGDGNAVARGQIRGINARGVSGTQPQIILFKTSGDGEIFSVVVSGVVIPNTSAAGITFQQNSSGSIRRVSLDDIQDAASSGNCIEFIQTAGSINNIAIGAAVQTARANDIVETIGTSGGVTAISVAMRGRRKGKTAAFTVPYSGIDDGVFYHLQSGSVTVTLPNNVDGAVPMSFQIATSSGATLSISGGTINGAGTKALTANQLYTVAMTRNAGNCQWFTQG